jgi:hypothetical protein
LAYQGIPNRKPLKIKGIPLAYQVKSTMNILPEYKPKGGNNINLQTKCDEELTFLIQDTARRYNFLSVHEYVRTVLYSHGKGFLVSNPDTSNEQVNQKNTELEGLRLQLNNSKSEISRLNKEIELLSKTPQKIPHDTNSIIGVSLNTFENDTPNVEGYLNGIPLAYQGHTKGIPKSEAPDNQGHTKGIPKEYQGNTDSINNNINSIETVSQEDTNGIAKGINKNDDTIDEPLLEYVRRLQDNEVKLTNALKNCNDAYIKAEMGGDASILLKQSETALFSLIEYMRIHFSQCFPKGQIKPILINNIRQSYISFPHIQDPYL